MFFSSAAQTATFTFLWALYSQVATENKSRLTPFRFAVGKKPTSMSSAQHAAMAVLFLPHPARHQDKQSDLFPLLPVSTQWRDGCPRRGES